MNKCPKAAMPRVRSDLCNRAPQTQALLALLRVSELFLIRPPSLVLAHCTKIAGLYVDGLTQTCAALRRRIAELEEDNRALRKRTSHDNGSGRGSDGNGKLEDSPQESPSVVAAAAATAQLEADAAMMAMLSPSAKIVGGKGGGGEKRRGAGFKSTG